MRSILSATLCPLCLPDEHRLGFVDGLIKGIWDAFPVTQGHLLLTPHRHVASWSDLHTSERVALVHGIDRARTLLDEKFGPDGFNIGFNDGAAAGQSIPHFHIHVIPRRHGDVPDPRGGVRHVILGSANDLRTPIDDTQPSPVGGGPHDRALIAGGEDGLIKHLLPHIDLASSVDVAVSFTMESGVRMLQPHLQDLLDRDGQLRFVTGDYLDVTDPDALRRLMDLKGKVSLHVFEAGLTGFHPKSWIFHFADGSGIAVVGSSNLSATALRTGVEWNYRVYTPDQQGGWRDVLGGFEALIKRPEIKPLTDEWIDAYDARRAVQGSIQFEAAEVTPEFELKTPAAHSIQLRALAALEETRRSGYTAGMVVLATGLGKTWLSAFDSDRPEIRRILFVAHREEILTQAMETFRLCRPKGRFGRYSGAEKDLNADVLFASIQTLGRVAHLRQFSPAAFDYIVIDEFHHAAARTYRGLIDHFTPKFLLGLTATPDRMDGGDLLGLCQENLVFRCDAFEGIEAGLLSRFSYFGVPDSVDYSNIPWRSTGFDEKELTAALATGARAQNALEQHQLHGGQRTLAFCCSQRHADFMANFFNEHGLKTVAVHSGAKSAPRATSLHALAAGELDVVFAVDMFNEGVDVPKIDTVLMLRPTESTVIWTQQFGRGLRLSEGKDRLKVVDYIGNHRIFLTKVRAMLNCKEGDRALALDLEKLSQGNARLPAGCDVTYELSALNILRSLLRPTSQGDAVEAFYVDFKQRHGVRPTALEVFHAGFNPRASGHGSWFDFVGYRQDLTLAETQVFAGHHELLQILSAISMTNSDKMLILLAMQSEGAFPGAIEIGRLTQRFAALANRNPEFRRNARVPLDDEQGLRRLLIDNPIEGWTRARGPAGRAFFEFEDGQFRTIFQVPAGAEATLNDMMREVIDFRLAEYLDRRPFAEEVFGARDHSAAPETGEFLGGGPERAEPWREYMREEIPSLYGLRFTKGSWNQGFVVEGRDVFLLVTLNKNNLPSGQTYEDGFPDSRRLQWHSQNRTSRASKHGKIISQTLPGYALHLFVRANKTRGGKGAPFTYCGDIDFEAWEGEKPIAVRFQLRAPVPEHLRRLFGLR